MLTYGLDLPHGLFQFLSSLGLCFWAMALAWDAPPRGWLMAVPLVALAYVAHALPVVWTAGVLAYAWVWGRLRSRARLYLLGTGLAALVLIHATIVLSFKTLWFTQQIRFVTGADQLWVFGGKYQLAVYALLAVWTWMAVRRSRGSPAVGALLPVAILTAAAIFLIPYAIWLPQYQHQLAYVSQRLSLPLAIAICAILAGAPPRSWQITAIAAVALLFFGFLYTDEGGAERLRGPLGSRGGKSPARPAGGAIDQPARQPSTCPDAHDRPRLHRPLLELRQLRAVERTVSHPGWRKNVDCGGHRCRFRVTAIRRLRGEAG